MLQSQANVSVARYETRRLEVSRKKEQLAETKSYLSLARWHCKVKDSSE